MQTLMAPRCLGFLCFTIKAAWQLPDTRHQTSQVSHYPLFPIVALSYMVNYYFQIIFIYFLISMDSAQAFRDTELANKWECLFLLLFLLVLFFSSQFYYYYYQFLIIIVIMLFTSYLVLFSFFFFFSLSLSPSPSSSSSSSVFFYLSPSKTNTNNAKKFIVSLLQLFQKLLPGGSL